MWYVIWWYEDSIGAVASMRQTKALDSLIFFGFVFVCSLNAYSNHEHCVNHIFCFWLQPWVYITIYLCIAFKMVNWMISLSGKSFYLCCSVLLQKKTSAGFVTCSAALQQSYITRASMWCSKCYFLLCFNSGYLWHFVNFAFVI